MERIVGRPGSHVDNDRREAGRKLRIPRRIDAGGKEQSDAEKVTYISNGTTVTLTRTSATTAFATLHSSQGDATAQLTKQ